MERKAIKLCRFEGDRYHIVDHFGDCITPERGIVATEIYTYLQTKGYKPDQKTVNDAVKLIGSCAISFVRLSFEKYARGVSA